MTISELAKEFGFIIYYNDRSAARRFELVNKSNGTTVLAFRTMEDLRQYVSDVAVR